MNKTDSGPFIAFMQAEALKYGREITSEELKLWFSEFSKLTFDEFKAVFEAWKTGQYGHMFPKVVDLNNLRRKQRAQAANSDPRCSATVGQERCFYPASVSASVHGGGQGKCIGHFMLRSGPDHDANALQIIEASKAYEPPKNALEVMERGEELRRIAGERWRAAHPELYRTVTTTRRGAVDELEYRDLPANPIAPPPGFEDIPPPDGEYSAPLEGP